MSSGHELSGDSALDATREMTTVVSPSPSGGHGPVAVIEGSAPGLSCEMKSVLRWRLRISAIVLFGGFAAFLIFRLITGSKFGGDDGTSMLVAHAGVTGLLGLMGLAMCRKCDISIVMLRIDELLIFGAPAAFFVLIQWDWVSTCVADHQVIPALAGPWFMLMFTYALFIPNSWQRAAIVLGVMASIPLALLMTLWHHDASCGALLSNDPRLFVEHVLMLAIAAVAGTVGTYTIGSLRREAFEAKQLGQYRLKQLIGVGGMGEVHLAEHQMMKRPCAIKLIHPEKAGDPKALARFEREVRATAKLSHWNTVEIFDYGRAENGAFYYVMEYLPGLSLAELIEQHGPLEAARVIYLMRQVADALSEAHNAGLIHRDIKPGNIFSAQRGGMYDVAKLLDFGLVKPVADIDDAHITQEGTITGSPLYLSPEQATGDFEADERSDIYSLGAVMYHLLTGRTPFESDKPVKILMAHVYENVLPPSEVVAEIPHDLEQIVMRCLEKKPSDRFQSAEELVEALAACEAADAWNRQRARDWWIGNTSAPQPAAAVAGV